MSDPAKIHEFQHSLSRVRTITFASLAGIGFRKGCAGVPEGAVNRVRPGNLSACLLRNIAKGRAMLSSFRYREKSRARLLPCPANAVTRPVRHLELTQRP